MHPHEDGTREEKKRVITRGEEKEKEASEERNENE